MAYYKIRFKGGPGSGHFGHKGRPGHKGGSLPRDGSAGTFVSMDKGSLKSVVSAKEHDKLAKAGYFKSAQFYDKQVMLRPSTAAGRRMAAEYSFPRRLNVVADKREDGMWYGEINLDGSINDLVSAMPGISPRLTYEDSNLQSLLNNLNVTLTEVAHIFGGVVDKR